MTEHIAIVSETASVTVDELALVSAALQKQVTRDLSPLWNINATVDAFPKLENVPIGYWHVLIRDDIDGDEDGIHQLDTMKQPYALVRHGPQWSITASHEVLEVLVDPFGNRLSAGDSPKSDQGRVLFLTEICDPCQSAAVGYTVNGVLVSDFCTPEYFAPTGTTGARYSFTGSITAPREVLQDGYLTWIYPATGHLWQLLIEDGQRRLTDVGPQPPTAACLRLTADRPRAALRARATSRKPREILQLSDGPETVGSHKPVAPTPSEAMAALLWHQVRRQIRR